MNKIITSIKISKADLSKTKDDALVIGLFKEKGLGAELKRLDSQFGSIINSFIEKNDFKGEKGEIKGIFVNNNVKNIFLVGLGEEEKYSLDAMSTIIADASKRLRDLEIESFSIFLSSFSSKFSEEEAVEKIALSSLMGLYRFTEYKTKDKDKIRYVNKITIITDSPKNFEKRIEYASIAADAVSKTRDLINMPPNVATPEFVANYAKKLAKPNLKCTIFDEKQIEKMKMGCFMAVAKGSVNKPRLVIMEYCGAGKSKKPIAIVGKGITFEAVSLHIEHER